MECGDKCGTCRESETFWEGSTGATQWVQIQGGGTETWYYCFNYWICSYFFQYTNFSSNMVIYSLSSPIPGFNKQAACTGEVLRVWQWKDMCWGELILSGLVWQANTLLPICCGWEDVHGVNGFEHERTQQGHPMGKISARWLLIRCLHWSTFSNYL